jgi:phosphosulfolactate synthase
MNYHLNNIPDRPVKPRQSGLTMVMDKGLSLRQVEDFIDVAGVHTDIVKLGWATSYVTPNLKEKLAIYKSAGIPVYFGLPSCARPVRDGIRGGFGWVDHD